VGGPRPGRSSPDGQRFPIGDAAHLSVRREGLNAGLHEYPSARAEALTALDRRSRRLAFATSCVDVGSVRYRPEGM